MAQLTKAEYFPISPLILRPDFKVPFDIFLRHENNYVLFNALGRTLTKAKRNELAVAGIVTIYIDKRALKLYHNYIQSNLLDLLEDETVAIHERAQAWTNTAAALAKELFESNLPGPAFKQRYGRFEEMVRTSASFIKSPNPLKHLARFIGKGYDIYHHGISTMVYTVNLLQEYRLPEADLLAAGMGALLHDIGKVNMSDEVINTDPADMSPELFATYAMHPMIAVRVCSNFDLPIVATNCILFHHERMDGKGFPTQATGEEIPLPTRVVALCNRYDNMTRNLPYSRAMRPYDALKALTDDKGLVEPDMLKRFIKLLSKAEIV
ncbi:HD-GYP domain-containing protein [Pseudodesulfovibrio indicus]|jgi:putative nucleotidyltransferase with HDIG domain|uniref:Metal-dependent phosphohydrolase n=1 Tax=Pseudodesulfovibrio indicus TaxID=1716143 RepID=A0A126QM23_9BACT|nr:HD domain-containing phosphohydrolase [Pseudodesulfovibrio indicus]AMK11113.1 metal-dependent phosphohydrolase [Pseudodesulfovibrio indicus]TDT92129.1 putative nucleotidyltransferase with HDIG domain [Pseudodesulfovibrio indicus]